MDHPPLSLPYRTDLAGSLSALVSMWWAPSYRAALIEEAGQTLGLSEARILWELGYRGTARPSELALAMEIGAPSISKAIAKLRSRGFVQQSRSESDGRVHQISLTESGERVTRRLYDVGDDMVNRIVGDWPADRIQQFAALLSTFVAGAASAIEAAETVHENT